MANKVGNLVDWVLFKRVLALATPFKRGFALACFLAIAMAILTPLTPYLIQHTVDSFIMIGDYNGLVRMSIILLVLLIITSFFRYFFIYTTNWLGQTIIKDLRIKVFQHISSLRLRYFDTTPIGQSTTRAINDVETINDIFSQGLITILADLLKIGVVLAIMFYTDWKLTLVSLATFPFFVYATYIFKEKIKVAFQTIRTRVSDMNTFLQERISGMSVVQIFGAEEKEKERFVLINEDYKQAQIRAVWYYSIFFPVLEVIQASALGLLVWFGANQVLNGQATIGTLIAFILYINMLFRPMRMLADKFNTLQMGLVASERVFTLLDRDEKINNTGNLNSGDMKGHIEFDDIHFAYNEVDMVLKGVSFEIKAGKMLALVGATGAGKSSIINILNRFYDIQKGSIKIDGELVENYQLSYLRSNIGLILQDVFLFSGSIHDNITLRNKEITREEVIQAAKFVGAHEFIEKLPGKYDYNVMERGATLSLGQRQLVSIVRTFVFNPRILIMDEATSSIDTQTELMVQAATDRLMQNRTAIVIAHRLSTIQNADKIIVLEKGKIIEIGTHDELLSFEGHYKQLHDMQFSQSEAS